MKIKIKRFDKSLPLPAYQTAGAACMDAYARETVTIEPNSIGYIPLNVAIEAPEGHWVMLAARSSTHKAGLIPANGIGIGDSDFSGNNDEYKFIVYNYKDSAVTIDRGTRIAQFMILKVENVEIEEVEYLGNPDRGGIGSTGNL
jgi:dUTP pyrophosphatase